MRHLLKYLLTNERCKAKKEWPQCKSKVKGVRVEGEVRHLLKYLLTKERW